MKAILTGLLLIGAMSSFASSEQEANCTEMEVTSEYLQKQISKIVQTCRRGCTSDFKIEAIDSLSLAKEIVDKKVEEECR